MSERRIIVRRDGPEPARPWRASLLVPDGTDRDLLVGFYPTHPEALMRAITAARFVVTGIAWRAEGLPSIEAAS